MNVKSLLMLKYKYSPFPLISLGQLQTLHVRDLLLSTNLGLLGKIHSGLNIKRV